MNEPCSDSLVHQSSLQQHDVYNTTLTVCIVFCDLYLLILYHFSGIKSNIMKYTIFVYWLWFLFPSSLHLFLIFKTGFDVFPFFCQKFKLALISTSRCKIWWTADDLRPNFCVCSILNMAAGRHLGFSYYRNICQKLKLALISTSTCKIWWKSDYSRPSYFVFSNF